MAQKTNNNKTKPTQVSVADFLKEKAGRHFDDSRLLVKMFRAITGKPPKMWGPSIVGFGSMHYVYESGREGDMPLAAFSPRKPDLVIYLAPGMDDSGLFKKLGKHKMSKCCLYIKSLADVDVAVLEKLVREAVDLSLERYPQAQK
jgi:uncharacterized protein DUF1801